MLKKQLAIIVFALCAISSFAQVKVNGVIYDEYLEPFPGAKIEYGTISTASNSKGEFSIEIKEKLPQSIIISAFGFKTEYLEIVRADKKVNVILKESILLDQVVISASRVPERIIESPVTIERLGLSDIRKNTSNSFYDGLTNLKGINSRELSYGFKSINTRGFADFTNTRFVQMVDGMDTAAQALSYSTGNFSGVSELDIHSVEILPGAASALYGANAYNGIMLMNTKNPFDFTGVTTMVKTGYTSQKSASNEPFYDVAVRMAHKFDDRFAVKVNLSYFSVDEWVANDYRNTLVDSKNIADGSLNTTPNYDGVNIYGDESFYGLSLVKDYYNNQGMNHTYDIERSLLARREGYKETDILRGTFRSKNLRFSGALHYRPFGDKSLEVQLTSRLSLRDNLFQGNDTRLAQHDYYIGQHRLEFKGSNFYVRGYYTSNNSGQSYDLTRTGSLLNDIAGTASGYAFNYYDKFYVEGKTHEEAIAYAGRNRLKAGTNEFYYNLERITNKLIGDGGSAIYEKSSYVHADGNYNFRSLLNNWADVQIGGSYRNYNPNSRGTLFNDANQSISIFEYGFYTQIQKKLLDDRLKLTGSIRYDKSENFKENYSPRLAVNYSLGEEKKHVLRASYQTGFRNPTVQEQYLFSKPSIKTIVGSVSDNIKAINIDAVNYFPQFNTTTNTSISGDDIINNALLTKTVYADGNYKGERRLLSDYKEVQPEEVKTLEVGYRSLFRLNNKNNLDIDINAFYSKHRNFVFAQDVVVPTYGKVYPYGKESLPQTEVDRLKSEGRWVGNKYYGDLIDQSGVAKLDKDANWAFQHGHVREFNLITNSKSLVDSYGFAVGLHTKLFKSFDFGLNYNFIDYTMEDFDNGSFEPNFNTPKHTVKFQVGSEKILDNFGFNINARWQDKYRWVSTFVKGDISARWVADAQLSYRIPSMKSRFKVGGTNLFGNEYFVAPGTGKIGQLYYISWIIND
ncbi:TonB-dependent receptor plug domain-containing protein [Tenacibaculum sp.]|nr:TonB-dependent receptor plug domain-containing protein [Tenacibaculum sp.]